MALHSIAALDGLALRELGELVAATDVFGLGGYDGEVAGEHAGGDLPAVGAVADESAYQAGCFGWLYIAVSACIGTLQLLESHIRREVALHHRNM